MNARLKVLHQKSSVKSVKLLPTTVVGRSTECDLKIVSSQVSRLHCRFTVHDDAVYIEDLGSANGTFINDQPLVPHQVTVVVPGTKIAIGPAEFLMDYVAPTTNTVVIRRSPKGANPAPQDFEIQTSDSDPDLFVSSPAEPIKAVTSVPVDSASVVPAVVAQALVSPAPVVSAPVVSAPVVSAPVPAAPAVALPVATPIGVTPVFTAAVILAPVAPASVNTAPVLANKVNESIVPTAKAINTPENRPPIPNIEPQQNQVIESAPYSAVSNANPVPPEVITPEIHSDFPNLNDTTLVIEGMTEFNFSEPSQAVRAAKPSAKGGKGTGIKSILSMFGGKPAKAKSKTNPESSQAPVDVASDQPEPVATSPVDVPAEPSAFEFIAAGPEPEGAKDTVQKPPEDDDFQKFLQQF